MMTQGVLACSGHQHLLDGGLQAVLEEDGGMEMTEEDRLLVRMDAGLYSLQQCALVVGHLWFVGDMGVRKRLLQLLHQQVMAEYYSCP